jgi:hypothetical protein
MPRAASAVAAGAFGAASTTAPSRLACRRRRAGAIPSGPRPFVGQCGPSSPPSDHVRDMSALPPIATKQLTSSKVAEGPRRGSCAAQISRSLGIDQWKLLWPRPHRVGREGRAPRTRRPCASRVTRQRAMTVVGHERQRSPFGLSGCFHHGLRPSLGPVGRTPMRRKRPFEWQ